MLVEDGSRRFDARIPLDRSEAMAQLEQFVPVMLDVVEVDGKNLRTLLGQAYGYTNDYASDVVNVNALFHGEGRKFDRIEIRYYEDVPKPTKDGVTDNTQLILIKEPMPFAYGTGRIETLFAAWTAETTSPSDELYVNFVDRDTSFSVRPDLHIHHHARPGWTRKKRVAIDTSVATRPDGLSVVTIAYKGFPAQGQEGALILPTALPSPRPQVE